MTIQTREQLRQLNGSRVAGRQLEPSSVANEQVTTIRTNLPPAPACPWMIPPARELSAPKAGSFYTQGEVAGICGVAVATVRDWACRGRIVDGRAVRLRTLRVPRARVSPGALCAFLSAVNQVPVTVRPVKVREEA